MSEREKQLEALLCECRTILVGQTFIMPQLKAAHQPIIDKITAALTPKSEEAA